MSEVENILKSFKFVTYYHDGGLVETQLRHIFTELAGIDRQCRNT